MFKKTFSNHLQKIWALVTLVVIVALLLSSCGGTQKAKTYKVGILLGLEFIADPILEGFKTRMAELG